MNKSRVSSLLHKFESSVPQGESVVSDKFKVPKTVVNKDKSITYQIPKTITIEELHNLQEDDEVTGYYTAGKLKNKSMTLTLTMKRGKDSDKNPTEWLVKDNYRSVEMSCEGLTQTDTFVITSVKKA